ncbi:MAG: hypothetical protein Q4A64_07045 [Porphyromonadaceae bacterium]|nr:hypothetical protein [Porphyromonadaceae bacterium]
MSSTTVSGKKRIFCRYIVRNGVPIYPKNGKCFSFEVDDDVA